MRPEIVLASASPRRLEILKMFRLNPVVSVSDVEEKVEEGLTPDKIVIGLSCIKGEAVAPRYPEALVVSADTVVAYEGKILGKPRGEREAYEMLKSLSGTSHEVYTGYSMFFGGRCVSRAVRTVVKFKKLSDYEIKEYIKTGEPFDKSGVLIWNKRESLMYQGFLSFLFFVIKISNELSRLRCQFRCSK